MNTQAAQSQEKNSAPVSRVRSATREMLLYFFVVSAIAAVMATLFTAWSPDQFQGRTTNPNATPIVLGQAQPAAPMVEVEANAPTRTPRARKLIGIVAGHWMNDSGAVCSDGLTEVEINLNIASLVQKILREKGYDVDVLAEFDSRLNAYEADALISIHADSCGYYGDQATGYKVATSLAKYQPEQSTRLTACLRGRYGTHTGLAVHSLSVTPDMTDYHAFFEIDPMTPAAIIETGFMNLDRQFLTEKPDIAAQGIVSGIVCFLDNEPVYPVDVQVSPTSSPTP
jgi:N-acetylmuramoyl-L-alanine amidase